jgi:hypothetical protein
LAVRASSAFSRVIGAAPVGKGGGSSLPGGGPLGGATAGAGSVGSTVVGAGGGSVAHDSGTAIGKAIDKATESLRRTRRRDAVL